MEDLAVVVEQDEDGFFVSSCPALKGCWSQGRTEEEALANIEEAIRGWLEGHSAVAVVPPAPSPGGRPQGDRRGLLPLSRADA